MSKDERKDKFTLLELLGRDHPSIEIEFAFQDRENAVRALVKAYRAGHDTKTAAEELVHAQEALAALCPGMTAS